MSSLDPEPKSFPQSFKPRQLQITWGDDPRYWKVDRKGNGPAELLQVCWLEVKGKLSTPVKKDHKYVVKFKLSLKEKNYGWETPVFIMAKIGENGEDQLSEPIKLLEEGLPLQSVKGKEIPVGEKEIKNESDSVEGKEIPVGEKESKIQNETDSVKGKEISVEEKESKIKNESESVEGKEIPVGNKEFEIKSDKDDTLYFGLYEVWSGDWKSGLLVHEAIVEDRGEDRGK